MDEAVVALIDLHRGLERQGPGDEAFSRQLLDRLPALPAEPCVVDLGCGSGAGALLLARHFRSTVHAIDLAEPFLDELRERARAEGLDAFIRPIACDFADVPHEPGSVDLIWSEGAAYNLTFAGALRAWRPLLARQGVAVVSELSWWRDDIDPELRRFWLGAYPAIGDESTNRMRATEAGFEVLETHRLPARAWWDHYYNPLLARLATIHNPGPVMRSVIDEMLIEIDLFRRFSDQVGYTFYLLCAGDRAD